MTTHKKYLKLNYFMNKNELSEEEKDLNRKVLIGIGVGSLIAFSVITGSCHLYFLLI